MASRAWAASGRARPGPPAGAGRPVGSWGAAVDRARRSFDDLTRAGYSEGAAAAILDTALGLWADTAAAVLGGGGAGQGGADGGGAE